MMKNNIEKFCFTEENFILAKKIIAKYPEGKKSALLPLLDLAQRQHNGWLSRDVLEYVADYIDLPYITVYQVASFYSMFNLNPIGKYHIQICGTTPCWLKGAKTIMKTCEKITGISAGKTSDDNKFTISEVECLGACVDAPVVQINDDYYENLTEQEIIKLLKELP